MKRWLYIAWGIITLTVGAVLLSFTAKQQQKVICQQVEVRILNGKYNKFLENKDVLAQIENHGIKTKGEPIESINTLLIERILQHSPVIRNVAAYTNIKGQLIIEVEQRIPIVRIIDRTLQQYFIDEEGVVLPDRIKQIAHVLVANGNIPPISVRPGQNIIHLRNDSLSTNKALQNIFQVASFVAQDDFWKAQIEQIYVNEKGDMLLVPRVGDQIVVFGDASDLKEKFIKLKSMYYAFNQIGWNQYKILNLKYKNQIVCIKR
ncbi:MAG: cell division protein FtsQ/DivIB [Bacteroidales bacterium]